MEDKIKKYLNRECQQVSWSEYVGVVPFFSLYPDDKINEAVTLGVLSEIGEIAGVLKKELRKDNFEIYSRLEGEIGDTFWYCALAEYYDIFHFKFEDYFDLPFFDRTPYTKEHGHPMYEVFGSLQDLCDKYHLSFEHVLWKNLEKVYNRFNRNTIQGDGDER